MSSLPDLPALSDLEHRDEFIARHLGITPEDEARMLEVVGAASRAALIDGIVPPDIRRQRPMALPAPTTEADALAELQAIAARNRVLRNFIGQGYYGTHTPAVIQRNVLENPAWYTAYTPYQAEISQGRLEALLNFQTLVSDLTGMAIANASMLDEATAAAEAMTLAHRMTRSGSDHGGVFLVDADCHPQTLDVIRTRARPLNITVKLAPLSELAALLQDSDCYAVLAQYPGSTGAVPDLRPLIDAAHARGAAVCVAADLLALTLLTPPGELGADIVVGTTQRFGLPLGNGGPHAGYLACRDDYKRSLPGRLVGVSVDAHGQPAYRLALQTREQHIRREKATSNICTAQVLPAVIASLYAVYHGPQGLTRIAQRIHRYTAVLAHSLRELGYALAHDSCFDTLTLRTRQAAAIVALAEAQGVNLRRSAQDQVTLSLDETVTREDVARLWTIFAQPAVCPRSRPAAPDFDALAADVPDALPAAQRRTSTFLTHPVFHRHHSETSMLRYLRRLADKDLALDRGMIPLGSCTMKLNASSEMIPITWPEFAHIHPYAPASQRAGYTELDAQLRAWLCEATGYAGVSLQPNAGSQGEYAGLLAIRAWHAARGDPQRDICLIPSSAHGTNPASAHLAGLQVVVTACDAQGNVDLADLRAKCEQHRERLACVMITYPSTHGVFETQVKELCALVHDYGGRVYLDGANLNALVGIAAPGGFGGDVSHINLHKTFCIPHGGGGPGVGPVCVVEDLLPYLPGHQSALPLPLGEGGGEGSRVGAMSTAGPSQGAKAPSGGSAAHEVASVGAISAAPLGNASVLPISWMYIRMMGAEGLKAATEVAILSANYISARLRDHYPTLYASENGHVAHECILDLRPLKESSGVTAEDVAKRLIDYGFHAPTLSFPVPGTLMVEPTESEPLEELDRFVDAMIAIRGEIARVERGDWPRDDNPLKNAPHTAASLLAEAWPHPYARELAALPVPGLQDGKYWSPVGRIDNVYGDRHLFCSCAPIDGQTG